MNEEQEKHICENPKCGKEHDGSYGSGRFCSAKCKSAYNLSKVSKESRQKHLLKLHFSQRAQYGTWKCPHCEFIAETRAKLKEHRTIVHSEICKMGWAKGLTKETDSRIKWGNTLSERIKTGQIKPAWSGKHHSDESKQKISEGQKLAHKEGRNTSWIGRRKLSYAEQSWFNIFINEFGIQTFVNNYYVEKCHYWLDFAWPEKKIYFEVDGKTHLTKEGIEHDKIRTEILKANGWKLIGRCIWPEYQKLSIEDKEAFVKEMVSKIKSM